MNRRLLISYSFYYEGDYFKIRKAISDKQELPIKETDNALTIFDEEYPKKLLDLKYPPLVLFYRGDLSLLKKESIGVVGSRQACSYALKATERLVKKNNDKVVISGLAKGIDACGHENASKTIGILGCGINYIYPYCNRKLIERVAREGLILSEYPDLCKPYSYHFPFRNRIIAALSDKIYIMQSNARSGTMTSLNEALELGKEVKVLPYDIFDEYGINNNQLIYEGATPISIDEIAF